jgi:hypothetical protein
MLGIGIAGRFGFRLIRTENRAMEDSDEPCKGADSVQYLIVQCWRQGLILFCIVVAYKGIQMI